MKKLFILRTLTCACALLFLYSCSPDSPIQKEEGGGDEEKEEEVEMPDAWHDKIRQYPYPKTTNEVFINPAPLIVPQKMKKADYLRFELSRHPEFKEDETIRSGNVAWCMFNPHRTLDNGQWYWRFRSVGKDGTEQEWSEAYQFEITDKTPKFVTPAFETFVKGIPTRHPRLFCFLDDKIDNARKNITSHAEYKGLKDRASLALKADYSTLVNPYDKATEIKNHTQYLYQAYHLTRQRIYADKMLENIRILLAHPISDKQLFASNFGSSDIAGTFIETYDLLYDELTAAEQISSEELLLRVARYYFKMYCGMQENHIFDNHFWQHNMRVLFQLSFTLFDKNSYTDELLPMMEYYYEIWTARAPDSGFNRDGVWRNGSSYFNTNIKTLFYMPSLYSYLTKKDFLLHPWYQSVGKALVYTWPPESKSAGFGDGNEIGNEPHRLRAAFADFIARQTGDAYAGWYAQQCKKELVQDYELRLYRMVSDGQYASDLPQNAPKLIWYKDAGEVAIHSDLSHMENNMSLSFRSSTFGSGSHTVSNQNSFNLLYKGVDVYRSSGYYLNFSDAHNLMSYRHTRAHNTILVNGIGQPFSMSGYGCIPRAMGGEHISYCVGDASKAYAGISDDPMWIESFEKAGITQTPDNGFGTTPLTRYLRHVFVLHPNIVVLYDELEASESVRWDWLLHSPEKFDINQEQSSVTTTNKSKNFASVARLFSKQSFSITQTDQFVVPPTKVPDPKYPNQWHLNATFSPCNKNRILTIIQIVPEAASALPVNSLGDTYTCGNWNIRVPLDSSQPNSISISNPVNTASFNYQTGKPSKLHDLIDGQYQDIEMTDYKLISTRANELSF